MPRSSPPTSFPYKPKKFIMIICFVFFGLCTWILAEIGQTNEQGLNLILIRHVVEISFSPSQAALFYWALAACGGLFSLLGIFGFYKALTSQSQVIIFDKEIIIPLGMFNKSKTVTVPFKDIHSIELLKVHHQRILKIIHDKGKTQLSDVMLPNKAMLDEIYNILISRTEINS